MAGQSEKITDETEVSTTELATVLGVSARRVQQMAQDGTVPTCRKGFFRLADSVQRYIKFLSDGPMDEEDKKLEKARRVAETTMKASKATIAKLEAEELKGTMHRAEDVAALTEDLVYTIRGALNALPGRLAVDVAAVSTPAEASEVIRKEVSKVMRELAGYHYDPKKYEERVRERRDWSERDSDDEKARSRPAEQGHCQGNGRNASTGRPDRDRMGGAKPPPVGRECCRTRPLAYRAHPLPPRADERMDRPEGAAHRHGGRIPGRQVRISQ